MNEHGHPHEDGRGHGDERDWLMDPRAPADAEQARIERALAPVRFDASRWPVELGEAPEAEAGRDATRAPAARAAPASARPWKRVALPAAIAAGLALCAWLAWRAPRDSQPAPARAPDLSAFELVDAQGASGWDAGAGGAAPGDAQRLVCGPGGSARLRVGSIGSLELGESSRLRLERGDASGYRVFLEQGSLTASIFAAPRLFAVGTPAGLAVDLGCVYRTSVEPDGSAQIEVLSGRVSFEADGRHALVPAGAECRARPGRGPGVPLWSDAPAPLRAALSAFEAATGAEPRAAALAELLGASRARDSLTLFHLLERAEAAEREPLVARLESLVGLPLMLERARLVAGDAQALESWRDELRASW